MTESPDSSSSSSVVVSLKPPSSRVPAGEAQLVWPYRSWARWWEGRSPASFTQFHAAHPSSSSPAGLQPGLGVVDADLRQPGESAPGGAVTVQNLRLVTNIVAPGD